VDWRFETEVSSGCNAGMDHRLLPPIGLPPVLLREDMMTMIEIY